MLQLVSDNPWLVPVFLGVLIPITGIVFGTITGYLGRVRQAELDASLKHEMLQRGMSAEEIRMVIEASPRRRHRCGCDSAWAKPTHQPVDA